MRREDRRHGSNWLGSEILNSIMRMYDHVLKIFSYPWNIDNHNNNATITLARDGQNQNINTIGVACVLYINDNIVITPDIMVYRYCCAKSVVRHIILLRRISRRCCSPFRSGPTNGSKSGYILFWEAAHDLRFHRSDFTTVILYYYLSMFGIYILFSFITLFYSQFETSIYYYAN